MNDISLKERRKDGYNSEPSGLITEPGEHFFGGEGAMLVLLLTGLLRRQVR